MLVGLKSVTYNSGRVTEHSEVPLQPAATVPDATSTPSGRLLRAGHHQNFWRFHLGRLSKVRNDRLWGSPEIRIVVAKSVNVLGRVRTERSCQLIGDEMPVGFHLLHSPGHADQVVEDEQIGDQVVVLDEFSLLVSHILRDDAYHRQKKPIARNG